MRELRRAALAALAEPGVEAKLARSCSLAQDAATLRVGPCDLVWIDRVTALSTTQPLPGRESKPVLVAPDALPRRGLQKVEGRAALLHSLAHIEMNAVNLALDVVWRFAGLPEAFYLDWMQVAGEEALHFGLLASHLADLGFQYGDFPAHDGLWSMAERTRHDLLARLALVPRTLEARGLDASPAIRSRLAQAGDHRAAAILDRILSDEIGHVGIGNYWYGWLCAERTVDPIDTYRELAQLHSAPRLRGPFNLDARRAAGFTEAELEALLDAAG